MEYVTESGLHVEDRRHSRADGDDPRSWPSNPNVNPPPPAETVGPNASEGFGNTHVMYAGQVAGQPVAPPAVMPWSGWPVGWATPNWGNGAVGAFEELVGQISIVFGCIDLNSSLLATMPPYRLTKSGVDESLATGGSVLPPLPWMTNPQPEVYSGWGEAMKQVAVSYWLGETLLWATSRYADGTVRTWVVLNPGWVDIEMEGQTRTYEMGGVDITADVLHIRYFSWPGVARGVGPLEALANSLFGAGAMEDYQAGLALRGGIPWGVLKAPGNLTETQAEDMRERFVRARLSAMGAPAVLSGGVDLTPLTLNPRDMALLELRQFDEGRICTLLGVPPTLMGLPTGDRSMTYRNVESVYDFHWRAYMRPRAQLITEAISGWALPRGQSLELNRDDYVRPGFNERVSGYAQMFNILDQATGERAITIDEIRAAERLHTSEDEQEELTPEELVRLGAPKQAVWEAAGIPADQIERWQQLAADERDAQTRSTASVLGALDINQLTPTGRRQGGQRP